MKRALLMLLLIVAGGTIYSQTTYYWVGGVASANSITVGSNWNTSLDGSGGTRPSSTGASDILVFDGTNVGGATPISDTVTVLANGSITCAQMKFINNAWVKMIRASSGTSVITINGEAGDDFIVDASSGVIFNSTIGSIRIPLTKTSTITTTGRIEGTIKAYTTLQFRFENTTSGSPATFVFASGSKFFTNITSSSSSYAFGSSSQSSEKWVVFEAGSHLYYDGGFSPTGSGAGFSAIDMRPGSTWHHRATNSITGFGNFFSRKNFGNVIVENDATLTAMGAVYGIGDLTINAGSTFNLYDQGGQTGVTGNLIINGVLTAAAGSNELVMAGSAPQTISGTGAINVPGLIIADNAKVTLSKDVTVSTAATIYGDINFGTNKLIGAGTFRAMGKTAPVSATANLFVDSFFIKGNVGIPTTARGLSISGTGIAPNTSIVAFSTTGDTVYLSNPVVTSGTAVSLSVSSGGAVLETANADGFDPASGSVTLAGAQTYQDNINYIINAATTSPFGVTTASSPTEIYADFVEINAPVTFNRSVTIADHLTVNGKITLNPMSTIHIANTGVIDGAVGAANYIVTGVNTTNGDKASLQIDGVSGLRVFPVGSSANYLPVTLTPVSSSDFVITAFEGITEDGTPNGTPFTPLQKQTVVDAVWHVNRITGSGDAAMQINWPTALEGATFTTLPDTDIGMIRNNSFFWTLPGGIGDNTANTATAPAVSTFDFFSAGAVPQVDPFVFNALPTKTYGDPDFSGGATSLNTTQSIIYSSDNLSVATIVGDNIHIVGAGTANITASQATDGVYPAVSIQQSLTVEKADLEIKADDKLKFEGVANPTLTATYTGFVLGETPAALLTPAVITTTAVTASAPGTYPISVSGATSNNYDITFVNGTLTVQPKQSQVITFNALAPRNYGAADFGTGATSTNSTIPITYTSSNTNVATVTGNTIHITGAGTTTITASQAGNDGYFPAVPVQQTFTVNKVPLTVRVRDTSKVEFTPNPQFTITYTGFVLGETAANLSTQPVVNTSATTNSVAGNYTLTPENAVSQNYTFTYAAGRLTILPAGGDDKPSLIAFQNSNGNLTVRVYSTFPTLGDIVIFDMSGRPVARRNIFMPEGFAQVEVFISKAASGIHVVSLKGDGIKLQKLVSIIK